MSAYLQERNKSPNQLLPGFHFEKINLPPFNCEQNCNNIQCSLPQYHIQSLLCKKIKIQYLIIFCFIINIFLISYTKELSVTLNAIPVVQIYRTPFAMFSKNCTGFICIQYQIVFYNYYIDPFAVMFVDVSVVPSARTANFLSSRQKKRHLMATTRMRIQIFILFAFVACPHGMFGSILGLRLYCEYGLRLIHIYFGALSERLCTKSY